ncbi:MAG: glycosyltransferase [Saprospiraceae bacterium]|nr:glycosyltransferase [Saprospiraceae bacterium]
MRTLTTRLNVIVPCYNPPTGWADALVARFSLFREAVADVVDNTGLIVVNDGSTSENAELIFNRLSEILPEVKIVTYAGNRGKGYALRQGVKASEADFHLVTDADFPYTVESMRRIAITLREHGGIAAGNRDTAYYDQVPAFRRWLSKGLRWLLRNVLRQPIGDSQCGLKGFDAAGKRVFLETSIDRFLFDLEFLMLANGRVSVTPVAVELREGVTFSKVGWRILATEGRNFIWLLVRRRKTA